MSIITPTQIAELVTKLAESQKREAGLRKACNIALRYLLIMSDEDVKQIRAALIP